MEAVLVLLGIAVLLTPAATIWLVVRVVRLSREVADLKTRTALPAEPAPEAPAAPAVAKANDDAGQPAAEPAIAEPAPAAVTPARSSRSGPFFADRAAAWLRANWTFAVAAVSLALAGLFLVQYGVERGYLGPSARVAAAILLGILLVAAAEWARRKGARDEDGFFAALPSTFASAGLVSVFTGIVAARQLYGLIGPVPTFAGLAATAAGGLILGWLYGPLLSSVALAGAFLAPFLTGGGAENVDWLFGYFVLVAGLGLGIDSVRRWRWVSALALAGGFLSVTLLYLLGGTAPGFAAALAALVGLAVAVPVWSPWPGHEGATLTEAALDAFHGRPVSRPAPTTVYAAASMAAAAALPLLMVGDGVAGFWVAVALVGTLFLLTVFWLRSAPALSDLAALPAAGFLGLIWSAAETWAPAYSAFRSWTPPDPETAPPETATWLLAGAALAAALAAWRSLSVARFATLWSLGAALLLTATAFLLDLRWRPAEIIGDVPWALRVAAASVIAVLLAERHMRAEPERALRVSGFVIATLALISLAFATILADAALTVAFAVTVPVAAWLDRRFDLRPLLLAVAGGVAAVSWRLVVEPGLFWAWDARLSQLLIGYGVPVLLFALAWHLFDARARHGGRILVESAAIALGAILACLLLSRAVTSGGAELPYLQLGLWGTVWAIAGLAQFWRVRAGGILRRLRLALAALGGSLSLLFLAAAAALNPVVTGEPVPGVPVLNALFVAYALPALAIGAAAYRFDHAIRWLRRALAVLSGALAVFWVFLAIRHAWRGDDMAGFAMSDGELYSYTVALLVAAAGCLASAFVRRSEPLRKAAMGVLALAIAKVFLVDMAGLTGLVRVFSFLALGLSLAGLALVNRWLAGALAAQPSDAPR